MPWIADDDKPKSGWVADDEPDGTALNLLKRLAGGVEGVPEGVVNSMVAPIVGTAGNLFGMAKGDSVADTLNRSQQWQDKVQIPSATDYGQQTQDMVKDVAGTAVEGVRSAMGKAAQMPNAKPMTRGYGPQPTYDPLSPAVVNSNQALQSLAEGGFDVGSMVEGVRGVGKFAKGKLQPNPLSEEDIQAALKATQGQPNAGSWVPDQPQADVPLQSLPMSENGLMPGYEPPTPHPDTPFPTLNEGPQETPTIPGATPFTPDTSPIAHTEPPSVDSNYESLTGVKSPDTPLPSLSPTDQALIDPSIEQARIEGMQDNTHTNALRNDFPSIDFPLRQEVLERPEIQASIDAFRQEAADLQTAIAKGDKNAPALLDQLKQEFGAGMKQLGVDKPSDAYGRPLFESGTETKLPVETTDRPSLPSEPDRPYTAVTDPDKLTIGGKFAKQGEKGAKPIEKTNTFRGPKNQRGSVSMFGPKVGPSFMDRLRSAKKGLDEALNDHTDNLGAQAMAKGALREQLANMNESRARGDEAGFQEAAQNMGRHQEMLKQLKAEEGVNFANLSYAKDLHDRLQGQSEKSADVRPLRADPKQRGSIGDPKFLEFKNKLPDALKPKASALYKELQKRGQIETTPGSTAVQAVSNIPGLSKITSEVAPLDTRPFAEMKPLMDEQPPRSINIFARNLYSGANIMGFSKDSLIVRWTADHVNNSLQRATAKVADIILNKQTGVKAVLESLTDKEQVSLAQKMVASEGKGAPYQLDGREIEGHDAVRKMNDAAFDAMNEGRAANGLPPLEKRPGYLAARWIGDFKIPIIKTAEDGSKHLVTYIAAKTKWGAERAAKTFQPGEGYEMGPTEYRPVNRAVNDVDTAVRELTKMLEESDPGVGVIHDAYEKYLADQGQGFAGIPKHFENKAGIGGYEGNKPWVDPLQNAKDLFHSQMKYAEGMFKWSELQKANANLKQMFADHDLWNTHPDEMKYAKFYSDMAFGHHTVVERSINDMLDMAAKLTGVGRGVGSDWARSAKNMMTLKFLGFTNMYFPAAQMFEPMQALPSWLHYLKGRGAGGNPVIAYLKGMSDAVLPRGSMSPFGLKAYDWAHGQHLFDSFFVDQVRTATSKPYMEAADSFMKFIPSHAESFSRYTTFMTFAHMLNDSGLPFHEAMGTAAKLSNMAVQNFRQHERALVYRHLGIVGEMASTFTGYKHHQYSQAMAFINRNKWGMFAGLMGSQLVLGGALGMYGRDDVDRLVSGWNWVTSHANINAPYVQSLRAQILQKMPDWMSYGVASELIHSDLSNRLSAAGLIPEGPSSTMVPFWGDMSKTIENWGQAAMERTGHSVMAALHQTLPTGGKAIIEEMNKTPQGMYVNPTTGEGQYKRNLWDRTARMMGGYSLDESKSRANAQEEQSQTLWGKTMKESIVNQFVHTEDPGSRQSLGQRYLQLGGTLQSLQKDVMEHKINENLSESQRAAGIPGMLHGKPDLNTILQMQRARQYGEPNK